MADDFYTPKATERLALLNVLGVDLSALDFRARAAIEALCDEVLVLREDADELRDALDEAVSLADNDALCPVFNRRAFEREIRREIALAARFRTPLSMIYIAMRARPISWVGLAGMNSESFWRRPMWTTAG